MKETSTKENSSKLTSKVDDGVGAKERSKHKFDKDEENIKEVVTLSSKIAAKCKLKKVAKKAALGKEGKADLGKEGKESEDKHLSNLVMGRPKRRVSKVNYSEGVLEKGAATAEVDNASEGNRSADEEDVGEELRPSSGKRKGKSKLGEPEAEELGCSREM